MAGPQNVVAGWPPIFECVGVHGAADVWTASTLWTDPARAGVALAAKITSEIKPANTARCISASS